MSEKITKVPYWKLLQDPRWQKTRLKIMERDGFKCQDCDDTTKTLNVHHRYYVSGRMPWEYPDFALLTICEDCHTAKKDSKEHDDWEIILGRIFQLKKPHPEFFEMMFCNCKSDSDAIVKLFEDDEARQYEEHLDYLGPKGRARELAHYAIHALSHLDFSGKIRLERGLYER